ncbi:hypothetical protein OIO90_004756 [Microbotryomycetes sp. JL221]|nr:hypothetical protein OIO90_004756 [Microbotryomycetes sp. JL221]
MTAVAPQKRPRQSFKLEHDHQTRDTTSTRPIKRARSTPSPPRPTSSSLSTPPQQSTPARLWNTTLNKINSVFRSRKHPLVKQSLQQYKLEAQKRSPPIQSSKPNSLLQQHHHHNDDHHRDHTLAHSIASLDRTPFNRTTPNMNRQRSASARRTQQHHDDTIDNYQSYLDRKFRDAIAKASGQEPRSNYQSSSSSSLLASQLNGFKKRPPMGQHKHRQEVVKRDQQRQSLLMQETCQSREELARQESLAEYQRRVSNLQAGDGLVRNDSFTELSRPSLLQRTTSSHRKLSSSFVTNKPVVTKDMKTTLRLANEVANTPRPLTPKFDEMLQRLKDVELKASTEFDQKSRKRKFPTKLSHDQQEVVDHEIFGNRQFESQIDGASVQHKDIIRLKGLTWLNDEIITFYCQLINSRSLKAQQDLNSNQTKLKQSNAVELKKVFCFNSFFYNSLSTGGHKKVKRWTKRVDLFDQDVVIVPINHGNAHWVCAAINIRDKRFEYYDSLGNTNPTVFKRLREYIAEEYRIKKGSELDLSQWQDYSDEDVPLQANSSDCGVFTAQFMETLSRKVEGFDFTQAQMK